MMKSHFKLCLLALLVSKFCTFSVADTVSDDDIRAVRETLPSNDLMTKVIDSCPLVLSNALLLDVKKQYNSTRIIPLSVFIDVFRLAQVDDLERRFEKFCQKSFLK